MISAIATEGTLPVVDEEPLDELDDLDGGAGDAIELTLAPPPPLAGQGRGHLWDRGTAVRTRREEKKELRDANADAVRRLVRRAGLTHAEVNFELNRVSGVRRVSEATSEQLERRLAEADAWLARA